MTYERTLLYLMRLSSMILNGLEVFLQDWSHRIENGPLDDGIVEVESLERRGSNRLSGTTNSLTKK